MPPLAAGAHEMEQPIQQASQVGRARAASGFGSRDERVQQVTLVIAQSSTGWRSPGRKPPGTSQTTAPANPSRQPSPPSKTGAELHRKFWNS